MDAFRSDLVTVYGGSGFLGRYVVRALARRGYRVRVAVRRPDLTHHLMPLGNVGQIHAVQANLRYPDSVRRAAADASHVVNLVGILAEGGKQRFEAVQHRGAHAVAEAARETGAGLTHVSAIGADSDSPSGYARTKGLAEIAVTREVPDATIMRPSIVFGPEDEFFNRFAAMAKFSPFLPVIGGGKTLFQPVYVADVAEAVAMSVAGETERGIYELGGPDVVSFKECMQRMLAAIERRRVLLPVPFWAANLMAGVAQYLPGAPLTPDQVRMLRENNVVSPVARAENRTLEGLGIRSASLAAIIPTYLVRFRPYGQYEPSRGL